MSFPKNCLPHCTAHSLPHDINLIYEYSRFLLPIMPYSYDDIVSLCVHSMYLEWLLNCSRLPYNTKLNLFPSRFSDNTLRVFFFSLRKKKLYICEIEENWKTFLSLLDFCSLFQLASPLESAFAFENVEQIFKKHFAMSFRSLAVTWLSIAIVRKNFTRIEFSLNTHTHTTCG
jgi:hypothetical protein